VDREVGVSQLAIRQASAARPVHFRYVDIGAENRSLTLKAKLTSDNFAGFSPNVIARNLLLLLLIPPQTSKSDHEQEQEQEQE
jgi:hypothetical protein